MSDIVDQSNELADQQLALAIANREPFELQSGRPGECDFCGEWYGYLVDGACVPCRNKYEKRQKLLR